MKSSTELNLQFCNKCNLYFFPDIENNAIPNNCNFCNGNLVNTDISYEKYKEMPKTKRCKKCKRKYPKLFVKCPKCNQQLIKLSIEDKQANKLVNSIIVETHQEQNIPKCPTCGSTNIEKISTTSKTIGFVAVGVFSSNFGKTMHCKNCGSKF